MNSSKPRVLISGSSGFLGKRFLETDLPFEFVSVSLRDKRNLEHIDWEQIDIVLHLAGIAHRSSDTPESLYFEVNRDLTIELAKLAKKAHIRQFVFMSSIKVFGDDLTYIKQNIPCEPTDPYGQSKLNAEYLLQEIASKDFTVSIIRTPVVYGPNVKGNIEKIVKIANSSLPLPFKGVDNRRTMIAVDNLIMFTRYLMEENISGTYLPTDERPISTEELVIEIRRVLGKSANLFNPTQFGRRLLQFLKPKIYERLYESYEVAPDYNDSLPIRPSVSIEEGIRIMVESIFPKG